jgi:hypothetical protein
VNAIDRRTGQRLLEHADHRHDACDSSLEAQLDLVGPRLLPQLLSVVGEQLLVRGDDVPACLHSSQQVLTRRLDSANQLDYQISLRENIVERTFRPGEDAGQLRSQPGDPLNPVSVLGEQRRECAADRSASQQTDPERRHRSMSRFIRSAYVSRRTTSRAAPSLQKTTGGRSIPL